MNNVVFTMSDRNIRFGLELFKFDGIPMLFIGYDDENRRYLCYYGETYSCRQWAIAQVQDGDLDRVIAQKLDVYRAFVNSGAKFFAKADDEGKLQCRRVTSYDDKNLPEQGTICDDFDIDWAKAELAKLPSGKPSKWEASKPLLMVVPNPPASGNQ